MHRSCSPLDWRALSWWLVVLGVVLALKQHYSIATAAQLDWMFRPLSWLLEGLSGHPFLQDSHHEWVSESADVRLVKACAGINFLLMSLMGWAWTLRPGHRAESHPVRWLAVRILLLCTVIIAAWVTSLLANSLRIIVMMTLDPQSAELHRLIGMLIYVPLLSLQLILGERKDSKAALTGPVLLYLLLMVVVPLLTGNAFQNPDLFIEHLLYVLLMTGVMCGIYFMFRQACSFNRIDPKQRLWNSGSPKRS